MITDSSSIGTRQYNNDILSHFATFQAKLQEKREKNAASSSAALALPATPPPKATQLDDASAEKAIEAVTVEAHNEPESISSVHKGLDPDRVARLLGLLD